jgi:hypothetical protein
MASLKQQDIPDPEDPVTTESVPSPIREALEHAENRCGLAERYLFGNEPCSQADDIERIINALVAVCEVNRLVVERLESISLFAQRLRTRAAEDYELATTKCSQTDSFMYVIGRSETLKIIADALDAALGGALSKETKVQP